MSMSKNTPAVKAKVMEIVRSNALAAIDQQNEYTDSISSYARNVRDTLVDEDLGMYLAFAQKLYYGYIAEQL